MLSRTKSGFTLIEIMVAIAIMVLIATIFVPSFRTSRPSYERKVFIGNLNSLLLFARQDAIVTNKMHKVLFDFDKQVIQVLSETNQKDSKGEPVYSLVKADYATTHIPIPEFVDIKNFYIDGTGFDEMSKFTGRKAGTVYFYVVPEGLAQEAIINFVDINDLTDGKPKAVGLVLNPFSAQFKDYDTFQK